MSLRLRVGPFILLLATATRFYRLDYQSLWSDEGNSVVLARADFSEIAARTAFDIHPPFYYWLLKIWVSLLGESEFAIRSLSAVLGLLLAAVIYALGRRLFNQRVGLAAAFVAALSPFQVYYAQETRMYMLLTLLGAVSIWLAIEWWLLANPQTTANETRNTQHATHPTPYVLRSTLYVLAVTLGLYTQYAFPLILAIINLTGLGVLWRTKRRLWQWLGLQLLPLLLYLPWLPIALRQITTWPSLREAASPGQIGLTLLRWLSLGPTAEAVASYWPAGLVGLALGGLFAAWVRSRRAGRADFAFGLVLLWLLLPAALAAFLFRPAYLKIFLMASPAFCLALALGLTGWGWGRGGGWSVITTALVVWPSLLSLGAYYADPRFQRDNYRGIAAFIEAVATPDDVVLLDAPGQQEVFGYYYRAGPDRASVQPLPHQRPIDPAATLAELESLTAQAGRIYAVYWATAEADPTGLIEGWLGEHTFKASDIWYGNVRLVSYAVAADEIPLTAANIRFGEAIELTGYGFTPRRLAPGDILQIRLAWQASAVLSEDYTVFIQLLDSANHLVGQQDARLQPPTSTWEPGQAVIADDGLYLEPGTPPGTYRLIAGLYDSLTGQRLPLTGATINADYLILGDVEIIGRETSLPIEAFRMQHRLQGPPLVGYDLYKLGHASDPATTLYAGDPLHLNLYWQQSAELSDAGAVDIQLLDQQGHSVGGLADQLIAAGYPTTDWSPAEIVRSQYDFFLSGVTPGRYRIEIVLTGRRVGKIENIVVSAN